MNTATNIHVIFTGGTIASRLENNIISNEGAPYLLIENYAKGCDSSCISFVTHEPYSILSENLSAKHLTLLIHTVAEIISSKDTPCDGIIITHGTDSIQYTSAILGYIFEEIDIPIILVSSAYVLSDKRANGFDNFNCAVSYIKDNNKAGVFVAYKNTDSDKAILHPGTRMLLPHTYSANMDSYNVNDYSESVLDADLCKRNYKPINSLFQDMSAVLNFELSANTSDILRLHIYPGMTYPALLGYKAVIFEGYHSGTLCIDEKLHAFTKEAHALNIPIYLTGLNGSEAFYETVLEYKKMGILPIPDSLPISLYCKLWITFSL